MEILRRFNAALERGMAKSVFDHVRNYMMCSLLLAIGVTWTGENVELLFNIIPKTYSSLSLVMLAIILYCLNLYDGIREISKAKHHSLFIVGIVIVYIAMSMVVIELAASFRASLQFT